MASNAKKPLTAKQSLEEVEELFKENEKGYVTYEKLIKLFDKSPTQANTKKIESLANKHKVTLKTSAEVAEIKNIEDAKKKALKAKKYIEENLDEEFDITNETELLEWGRSENPVRMYLREMGQISLLTKEEEIEISKQIELGEDIIIDAFCSVPYLIDFILDYKIPLINRERRVKELFKNFDEDNNEEDEDFEENEEDKNSNREKRNDKRAIRVTESFKALEKAKKDWLKYAEKNEDIIKEGEDMLYAKLSLTFKKKILKEKLMDLGPTSKLINEIVKQMETALKSDDHFEKELKRLEYRLPLFSKELKEASYK